MEREDQGCAGSLGLTSGKGQGISHSRARGPGVAYSGAAHRSWRTETTSWRRSRSHLASEGRDLPFPGFPLSLGTHCPPSRICWASSPAHGTFRDPWPGVGTRRGQTRPFPVNTPGIQPLSSPALLLPQVLGSFCASERTLPRSLWSWASHLSALNLRFHVCKMGARVSTSRGCGKPRACSEDVAPRKAGSLYLPCPRLAAPPSPRPESAPGPRTTSRAAELRVRPSARVGRGGLSGFLSFLRRDWERNRGLY